ncbi:MULTISPECIES: SIR2 family protein [unclassified Mycolicibacterium]|uniref:SIR2 family protein n=1 Tax=unclassified Mycolicibacterium TaxID=2636767 RepID=UPI002EDBB06A
MEHPDITRVEAHLRKAERPVVFFIGAGMSRPLGFPSWVEMIENLIEYGLSVKRLSEEQAVVARGLLTTYDYLSCGEYLRQKMGHRVDERLYEIFGGELPADLGVYDYLVRLPCAGFITTNYDSALESAYAKHFRRPLDALLSDDRARLATIGERKPFLFKLHGDADRRKFVLSTSDYEQIKSNEPLSRFLYSLFFNYELVFLGYGLGDNDILTVLDLLSRDFKERGPRHVALLPDTVTPDLRARLEDNYGIDIAPYDVAKDGHRPVLRTVAQWFVNLADAEADSPSRRGPADYPALLREYPDLLIPEQRDICREGLQRLLAMPTHWGLSPDGTPRAANTAEGLIALAATKYVLGQGYEPADEVDWLVGMQGDDGGFLSVTIGEVNTHTHALCLLALAQWAALKDEIPQVLADGRDWLLGAARPDEPGWARFTDDTRVAVVPSLMAFGALLNLDAFPRDTWIQFRDQLLINQQIGHTLGRTAASAAAAGWALWFVGQLAARGLAEERDHRLVDLALKQLTNRRSNFQSEHEAFEHIKKGGHGAWRSWHHPTAAAVALGAMAWLDERPEQAWDVFGRALAVVLRQVADSDAASTRDGGDHAGTEVFTFVWMYGVWALAEALQRLGAGRIVKAGLVAVDGRRLLLLRKRGRDLLILPGGTIESGETPAEALDRELKEELGVVASDVGFWDVFTSRAAFEPGVELEIHAFEGVLDGVPSARAEIADIVWFDLDSDDEHDLSPIIREQILPELRARLQP